MSKNEVRVGDVGTSIEMQVLKQDDQPYDIGDATLLEFKFQKPDGTVITRTADVLVDSDPADGWVQYITAADDLDQIGTWLYQVYIEKGSSVKHHTDYERLRIHPNLPLE